MELINNCLYKWEEKIFLKAMEISEKFICNQYNINSDFLDELKIKPSKTCRFPKYTHNTNTARIDVKRRDKIYLYNKKSLGTYTYRYCKMPLQIVWAHQIIHEITHFIQHKENRKFSEIESTINELEFLKQNDIETNWEKK